MPKRLYLVGIVVFSVVALVVLPNCSPSPGVTIPGRATGGGQIVKDTLDGRATFTFNGSSCSGTTTGRFNYNDKSGQAVSLFGKQGVMANGTITAFSQCLTTAGCTDGLNSCPAGGYLVAFDYESKNPNYPGTGIGQACIVDGGEGKAAPDDMAGIRFTTGPLVGYPGARGPVTGNVQGHLCD